MSNCGMCDTMTYCPVHRPAPGHRSGWDTTYIERENEAELARHHRHFGRISQIIEDAFQDVSVDIVGGGLVADRYERALREIRKIVG